MPWKFDDFPNDGLSKQGDSLGKDTYCQPWQPRNRTNQALSLDLHTHTHYNMHSYAYSHVFAHTCVCVGIHTHMCTHTHMHALQIKR